MQLTDSPTELTTAVTDAMLAVECLLIIVYLRRAMPGDRWRTSLWCWVFCLMAFSSILGAIAHGVALSVPVRDALWKPLYLSLGVVVALFLVGAIHDWRGRSVAATLVPWSIGVGAAFFGLSELLGGAFIVFIVYEATAMVGALAMYAFLAATGRLKGAGLIAMAIMLNLVAAGMQASNLSLVLLFPFDHNGLFHLVQMGGAATLCFGLARHQPPFGHPASFDFPSPLR